MATVVSTLLGTTTNVMLEAAAGVEYPGMDLVQTISHIYSERLYAKGLTALELASSGRIAFSPYDAFALYISRDTTGASNIVLIASASNATALKVNGPDDTSSVTMDGCGDLYLNAASNIYIKGERLVLDITNMDTTYSFVVNERGELELQQKMSSSLTSRCVARFGCRISDTTSIL